MALTKAQITQLTREQVIAGIVMQLEGVERRALEAQEKFIENFKTNPAYALSWAEDVAMQSEMERWAVIMLKHYNDSGADKLVEVIDAIKEDLERDLLKNYMRGRSTSMFSNAQDDAKREAAARTHEMLKGFQRSLAKADEE